MEICLALSACSQSRLSALSFRSAVSTGLGRWRASLVARASQLFSHLDCCLGASPPTAECRQAQVGFSEDDGGSPRRHRKAHPSEGKQCLWGEPSLNDGPCFGTPLCYDPPAIFRAPNRDHKSYVHVIGFMFVWCS